MLPVLVFNTVVALFKIQLHKSINFRVSKDLTYRIHTHSTERRECLSMVNTRGKCPNDRDGSKAKKNRYKLLSGQKL